MLELITPAFYSSLSELNNVNWAAVRATDFSSAEIKDGKQAEFLVSNWFPWQLVEKIGIFSQNIYSEVLDTIAAVTPSPVVQVERNWYY